ncbi:MAG: IS66 family insertion sequence element accessory protein TnpB [Erythrobacter sp.]
MTPSGARVWIALGHTDMRKGMLGLALLVQQGLKRNPHGGDLFVFRGRAGSLIKIIWHDGIGMSLYAKRLEKGRFVWPSAAEGTVSLNPLAAGLPAGGDRLAQPAVYVAAGERRIMVADRHFALAAEGG